MGVPISFPSCRMKIPLPLTGGGQEILQGHAVEYPTEILTRAE